MKVKFVLAGRTNRRTGMLVACALTLTSLLYPAPAPAVDVNPPRWNPGDYWMVKNVQINRLHPGREVAPAQQWLFCVVARTNISGVACYIVEQWPAPPVPAFAQQHTVYYFRASDLSIVRRIEWFYLQGNLCGPAIKNYFPRAETPHVDAAGLWLPALGESQNSSGRDRCDEHGQIVRQSGTTVLWRGNTNATFMGTSSDATLLLAARGQTGVEMTLTEGSGVGRIGHRQQVWLPGLPWFLYESDWIGSEMVGESWLTETGPAATGEAVVPYDPVDLSPLAASASATLPAAARAAASVEAAALPQETLSESYTAAVEPWAGCWWPFLDSSANANLYDTGSSGNNQWHAMQNYDSYFTPGRTPAWSWEYSNHRTTDSAKWWWGHCDGWGCASIMEPTKPLTPSGPFQGAEQEGLFAECWNTFNHALLYPSGGNVNDNVPMPPGGFWKMLRDNIRGDNTGGRHRPIGFDLYSCPASPHGNDQVWNYPVFAYTVNYAASDANVYAGTMTIRLEDDNATPTASAHTSTSVTYGFRDVVITSGVVDPNSGTWTSSSWTDDANGDGHAEYVYPDVAWYPSSPVGENPYIDYMNVRGMSRVAAPINLTASASGSNVQLAWVNQAGNAAGFKIEARSDSSGNWMQIAVVGASVNSCAVAASSSQHTYRVRAYNNTDGNSLFSNVALIGGGGPVPPVALVVNGPALAAAISSPGDVNWFTFTASTPGVYTIHTASGTLEDNYMYLYGPNSQTALLQQDDDNGSSLAAQIVRTLAAGTYYVKMRAYSASAAGTYTINVSAASSVTVVPLTMNAAPVAGTIASAVDADWYSFRVATAGAYMIDTVAGTLEDNYMYLYGPDSQTALLQQDDDSGAAYAARIVRTLAVGAYYVKVRGYSASDIGTYTIRVLSVPTTLTINAAPITGTIAPAGDADWYSFTVSTAGSYTIHTASGTLDDNYMYLYGPNSQTALLQQDDDNGNNLAAQIVRTLAVGTYYVKMRAYSATATGTYTINVLH